MKNAWSFALALIALSAGQSASGDSGWSREEIEQTAFSVEMTVGARHRVSAVSFESGGRHPLQARLVDQREVMALGLEKGTSILGTFRFNRLSGTDLGSGRVYSGAGTLTFDKVLTRDGGAAGCPPLCDGAVRLGVELRAGR